MQKRTIYLLSLVVAAVLGLSGCATTQILPQVAEEKPTSTQALVIVDGPDSWGGGVKLYAVRVYDNRTLVGKAGPHGKLAWLRDPGPMDISIDGLAGRRIAAVAGESYRYKVKNSTGLVYYVDGPGTSINYTPQPTLPQEPIFPLSPMNQYSIDKAQLEIHKAAQFPHLYENSMKR